MTSTHLPASSLRFLSDLRTHNDKGWFENNRDRYEADLLEPARLLVAQLCRELGAPFPDIVGSPVPRGGSLTRLHRDVRFSTDKRPFHTHIGMHFWHSSGRKMEVPGFFLRVDPDEVLIGTGLHQPEADVVARVRRAIDHDRAAWIAATQNRLFLRTWQGLAGESLKRVPSPWSSEDPLAQDLRRKEFTAFVHMPADEATRRGFSTRIVKHWRASAGLMAFLTEAMTP